MSFLLAETISPKPVHVSATSVRDGLANNERGCRSSRPFVRSLARGLHLGSEIARYVGGAEGSEAAQAEWGTERGPRSLARSLFLSF